MKTLMLEHVAVKAGEDVLMIGENRDMMRLQRLNDMEDPSSKDHCAGVAMNVA